LPINITEAKKSGEKRGATEENRGDTEVKEKSFTL
jgi:hypothetical protein